MKLPNPAAAQRNGIKIDETLSDIVDPLSTVCTHVDRRSGEAEHYCHHG